MKFYKWTADGKPIYGDGEYDLTGTPQPRIDGELVLCKRGYHVCTADQVPMWCGTELWEIEPIEIVECGTDKVLCRSWRVVRKMPWASEDMVAYARACADRAATRADAEARVHAARATAYADRAHADRAACAAARATAYADRAHADRAACAAARARATADRYNRVELKWQRQWIENRIGESL